MNSEDFAAYLLGLAIGLLVLCAMIVLRFGF